MPSSQGGQAWRGDVELNLFDSPTEELSRLTVDEIIGGYYRQVGVGLERRPEPRAPLGSD